MFVFLSKLLPLFVYPVGLACLLVVAGLLLVRRPALQRLALIAALAVLLLGGNSWTAAALVRSLEWRYLPPEPVPPAQAAVLLGGAMEVAEYPRQMAEINGAGDRLMAVAQLYHQGKVAHILITDGTLDWIGLEISPARDAAEILKLLGVPEEALWFEEQSRNTYENARYSATILQEQGVEHILLVTSASHMARAVRLFEAQGLQVTPYPVDYNLTRADWERLWRPDWRALLLGVIPSAENLQITTKVLKEYLGMLVYSIRGWK